MPAALLRSLWGSPLPTQLPAGPPCRGHPNNAPNQTLGWWGGGSAPTTPLRGAIHLEGCLPATAKGAGHIHTEEGGEVQVYPTGKRQRASQRVEADRARSIARKAHPSSLADMPAKHQRKESSARAAGQCGRG